MHACVCSSFKHASKNAIFFFENDMSTARTHNQTALIKEAVGSTFICEPAPEQRDLRGPRLKSAMDMV